MGLCGVNSGHEENEEGAGHEYNHTIEYRDNSSSWHEKVLLARLKRSFL